MPLISEPDSSGRPLLRPAAAVAAAGLLALLLWDAGGLDLPLARLAGGAEGFPLRDSVWMERLFHQGARNLGWLLLIGLALAVRWPPAPLKGLPRAARLQIVLAVLAGLLCIALLKFFSSTSCPWDLQAFGGTAAYVSHWRWGVADGGGGHCFPAGHASTGFAFLGGFFPLWRYRSRLAPWWLAGALIAGLLLGISQQLRGAHFTSHTLWTAWCCWVCGMAVDGLFQWWLRRRGR